MAQRLWVTGYRSWELNVYGDQDPKLTIIKYALKNALQVALDDGLEWVITGGELGVEQWVLGVAQPFKADYPALKTALMTPYQDFGHQWNETNQGLLTALQQQVDFTRATSTQPYQNGRQLAAYNRFMAQHTDAALFVYDEEFPGKPQYAFQTAKREADRRDYPITQVTMSDLEEAARNYAATQNDDFQS